MSDISKDQAHDGQRRKILSLLQTAHALANDLQEHQVALVIDRAIEQTVATLLRPRSQLSDK